MSQTSPETETLRAALETIAGWRKVNIQGEYEHGLRDIIRSITDCATTALDAAGHAQTPADREAIAQIIDPETFKSPRINLFKKAYEDAYAKADAILALSHSSTDRCICQDQHRRGYCTEPGCPYNRDRPTVSISSIERGDK